METAVSIALGIGLAAAAGFRVFIPLLALSIAGLTNTLELSQGFAWIGTIPALIAFGTATVVEVAAYYIPWVDNILDSIATPAAVVAGTIASASVITDISPLLKWVLALIGGGGIAGLIQGATVLARAKSSVVTAGLGNPVVATAELGGSIFTTVLSFLAPFLTIILVLLVCGLIFASARRLFFGHIGAPRE
ncbi:MAG TPA: DUF4126 domain-containing protein [Bacteroidota bacterium]|nr:DUF4126 domain-containing protein [Bacteroidota bacterium]